MANCKTWSSPSSLFVIQLVYDPYQTLSLVKMDLYCMIELLDTYNYVVQSLKCFTVHSVQYFVVSYPDPLPTLQRGKGGLVNIVQHICTTTLEFRWDNPIGQCGRLAIISPGLGFVTANHLTPQAYILFAEAQQGT